MGRATEDHKRRYGYKIALAQWRKLHPGAPMPDFWRDASAILRRPLISRKPTDAEWITVMNRFGELVRAEERER
ncbi:hypothetical protein [Afifella marina]|uniref:hypothetical protein n=1 Tax=Afifella marina TaxID=1080 RepID=UPI0011142E15|nr:hypothetical protein [Afifella marina]